MKLKNECPRKILIKDIPIDFDIVNSNGELSALEYNVHQVSFLKNFRTKFPMFIFLVHIFVNDQFKHILEIQSLIIFLITMKAYSFLITRWQSNVTTAICLTTQVNIVFFNSLCLKCSCEHV